MSKPWQTKRSAVAYRNRWYSVRHDEVIRPDGESGTYDVIDKPDFVVVIPKIGDRYCMVRQYRYAVQARSWEFPAGSLNDGESPAAAARRELREETGLRSAKLFRLGYFWAAGGIASFGFTVYLAIGCTGHEKCLEASEADMKSGLFAAGQIETMIKKGVIKDSESVSAWCRYRLTHKLTANRKRDPYRRASGVGQRPASKKG